MMVRRPDHEAYRRTSPSAEVKMSGTVPPLPPVCHQDMHEDALNF